jgi:hypothetical protein
MSMFPTARAGIAPALIGACAALWSPLSGAATDGLQCGHQRCFITITDNLSFEAAADAVHDGMFGIEVSGDVTVHTPSERLVLTRADLVFRPREQGAPVPFELYGTAQPPIAELPLFDQAAVRAQPVAAVGLVARKTLQDLLERGDYRLPLAENPVDPDGDPAELIEPAYLFFHFETGLSLDMPLGAWLGVDADAGEHDPFAFSIPGDKSLTFILDPTEPYFFLSQDARAMLMDALGAAYQEANARAQAQEAQAAAEAAQSDTGGANGDADVDTGGSDSDTGQTDGATDGDRRDGDDAADDERDSLLPEIGEMAFSWLGGIPFEPATTWGLPANVGHFKGHLYLDATVPLYKFIELTGKVVTHASAEGFEQGGNGDVQVAFDLIPNLLSFSFPLGNATAGVRVTEDDVTSYFSGIQSPDYSFLPAVIPVVPANDVRVAGYISSSYPEDSRIVASGSFGYDMSGFRSLTGLDLRDLILSQARLEIGVGGVSLTGRTGASLHPSIALGAEARVDIYFSPRSPEDSYVTMSGEMLVAGIGLQPVRLRLDRNGLFVDGAFVTPISEIAMAGRITKQGPSLSGSTSIGFDIGDVRAALESARAKVVEARGHVQGLTRVVEEQRAVVTDERRQAIAKLVTAKEALTAAQKRVDDLNAAIASHERAISGYRSQISAKHRWYKRQPWYKRSWAWAQYAAYRTGKNAQIAWRYAQIGTLNAAKAIAKSGLEVAKLAVSGIEGGLAAIPVDADPRVAGPLVALETATAALHVAEAALPKLPDIDADIRGHIAVTLTHTGIRGRLEASANGHNLANGKVSFGSRPEACIDLAGLGALCARF